MAAMIADETGKEFVVIRFDDGGYSFAIGCPSDTEWQFEVVARCDSREAAEKAIIADRAARREVS